MEETENRSEKLTWGMTLAGPCSWLLVYAVAWFASQGTDGGWKAMSVFFTGLAVILLIHLIAPTVLITKAISRRRANTFIGRASITGLCYYGLVATVVLIVEGPHELANDSIVILKALFRS